MPNPLYALRLVAPGHFAMAKFSMPDFNVEATYNLTQKGAGFSCDCPAGQRSVKLKPCKHQRMIPYMMGACNTDRFYEPETRAWVQPLAPELAEAIKAERAANGAVVRTLDRAPAPPEVHAKPATAAPTITRRI